VCQDKDTMKLPTCKKHTEDESGHHFDCDGCNEARFKGAMNVTQFVKQFSVTSAQLTTLDRMVAEHILY
jgi:hypothetical protein